MDKHSEVYTHAVDYDSALKRKEILTHAIQINRNMLHSTNSKETQALDLWGKDFNSLKYVHCCCCC